MNPGALAARRVAGLCARARIAVRIAFVLGAVLAAPSSSPAAPSAPPDRPSRAGEPAFAIAAYDSATASWGIACASGEVATGARCCDVSAEAGALVSLGAGPGALPFAARALAGGASPESALALLAPPGADPGARLGIVVARSGRASARAGSRLSGFAGTRAGRNMACAGLGLRGAATLDAMAAAFQNTSGDLGARLLAALEAGERADGDPFAARGRDDASAVIAVARAGVEPGSGSDRLTDLRVDLERDPIAALGRLYARHVETFLPAAHVRYGDAARRRGDEAAAAREYAAAEAGFRAAVARGPKEGEALNELAWFLATRGGDPHEALRFARAAVAARGDDPNFLDTLAEAAYRAGDLEEAIEAAERAARLAGGNARYAERLRAFRAAREALAPSSR